MAESVRRRGRPRSDRLEVLERVIVHLVESPSLSANEIHRLVGGRRSDVLRCVRAFRMTLEAR